MNCDEIITSIAVGQISLVAFFSVTRRGCAAKNEVIYSIIKWNSYRTESRDPVHSSLHSRVQIVYCGSVITHSSAHRNSGSEPHEMRSPQ